MARRTHYVVPTATRTQLLEDLRQRFPNVFGP